jgi:hypothetical protein
MDLLALATNVADRVEGAASRAEVPVPVCVIDIHGKRRPQAPHELNACLVHRALRAESLHVGAGVDANSRPASACAAWPAAVLADDSVGGQVLRDGLRGAAHQRGAGDCRCWRKRWNS